jgi:hypothetical protein
MLELIERARGLGITVFPAQTEIWLEWERRTSQRLPDDVRAFYAACDGFQYSGLWITPMPFAEVIRLLEDDPWFEAEDQALTDAVLPLFRDAGDNMLALLLATPCAGRYVYIHHETPYQPQLMYHSFYSALEQALEVYGIDDTIEDGIEDGFAATDYPAPQPFAGDGEAADGCMDFARACEDDLPHLFYLSLACGVLPPLRTNEMIGWLLDEQNMAQPIGEALAARGCGAAVPALVTVMLRFERDGGEFGSDLTWFADALATIDTLEAKTALLELGHMLSAKQLLALEPALKQMGATVTRGNPFIVGGYCLRVEFAGEEKRVLMGREVLGN